MLATSRWRAGVDRPTAGSPSRPSTTGMPSVFVCKVGDRFAALEPVAHRAPAPLRLGRGGRGPRPVTPDGPRQPVSVTTSSTRSASSAPASACSKSRRPTASSNVESRCTAGLSKSRRRARRRRRVRRASGAGASRSWPFEAREEYELRSTCVQETGCGTRLRRPLSPAANAGSLSTVSNSDPHNGHQCSRTWRCILSSNVSISPCAAIARRYSGSRSSRARRAECRPSLACSQRVFASRSSSRTPRIR